MATAATEINPVSEPELSSNILVINQDNLSTPPSCETTASREPLENVMEALALSGYGQGNQFPVYTPPEMDEKLHSETVDEAPAFISPPCNNRSPPQDIKLYNDNNNSFKLAEDVKPLQPQVLFAENKQTNNYIRQDSYTQTNEDRGNLHQAAGNYYTDLNGKFHRNINFTEREIPDSISIPFKLPDPPQRRYAWGDERQSHLHNDVGYNSDSDILKNKSKNKKSSLNGPPCGSYESTSGFTQGHRRVRSGDAPMLNITKNNNNMVQFSSDMHQNAGHPLMHHSQSQGNIHQQMHPRQVPALNQSISVDQAASGNTQIHEHLCLQSTMFVNLQAAIADATTEWEQHEKDVDSKLHELNVGLSIEHHTQDDCKLIEDDIRQLRKEIQAMYDECDQSGVQVPGDPPAERRISDLYPSYPASPSGSFTTSPSHTNQVYPVSPNIPLCAAPVTPTSQLPVTVQPGKRRKSKERPYENVPDFSRIDPTRHDSSRIDLGGGAYSSQSPPPIPPRQPMMIDVKPANEQWRCPSCTFVNLLVANCEMCATPRPCSLRNNIQR